MSREESIQTKDAALLKQQGTDAYKAGDFKNAIIHYSAAIDADPNNEKLYCNRSMCNSALKQWDLVAVDAMKAVQLCDTYVKAYFWLVKSMMEKGNFRDAKLFLLNGFNKCGENKEFIQLETLLLEITGIPLRPRSSDFEIIEELGTGNFTQIYKAAFKPTKREYAIKIIDKQQVDKMKKRHPNIHNEILMEKRVLNKLNHPNIVQLFSTYQDASALYYQMEFCGGGEVWSAINDGNGAVGCYWSLARFYMAEAINAVEYLHRNGIIHRDLKPENMMICSDGRLKLVDFGTAKDLVDTDLNGPNFVGTAEYMSPRTVGSKSVGFEVDLWALGVVLYQLFVGYTPFTAPSPYLSFIRIKRATIRHHVHTPKAFQELVSLLLTKDDRLRFKLCTDGMDLPPLPPSIPFEDPNKPSPTNQPKRILKTEVNPEARIVLYKDICYDRLRKHEFFADNTLECPQYGDINDFRVLHTFPAVRVPTLHEMCVRAVAKAVVITADAISQNGGIRPDDKHWMKALDISRLSFIDQEKVKHYLDRRDALHSPGIYRLFHQSLPDAKCKRINLSTLEYYGHTRALQGQYKGDFFFIQIADPQFGMKNDGPPEFSDGLGGVDWSFEEGHLKKAVAAINKLRPRFVLCSGDQTNAHPGQEMYIPQVVAFRKAISRISETIPVLYVCGNHDIGDHFTQHDLEQYRLHFGPDWYGFWYNGVRCLTLNSCLWVSPDRLPEEVKAMEEWFEEELEQAKLCSQHVMIFTHHPWYLKDVEEDGGDTAYWVIPKKTREKWMQIMRNKKVVAMFAGHYHRNLCTWPYPKAKASDALTSTDNTEELSAVKAGDDTDSDEDLDEYKIDENDVINPLGTSDADYKGPEMITTNSVGMSLDQQEGAGMRVCKIYEDKMIHEYYDCNELPNTVIM